MTIYWNEKKQLFIGQVYANEKRKSFYGKTKNEVVSKIDKFISEQNSTPYLKDWIVNWFELYKMKSYKKPTFEKEFDRTRRIRESALGEMRIAEIKPSDVQMFINDLNLSSKSIINILSLLKQSMKQAVAEQLIEVNPCDYVQKPKQAKPEMVALNNFEKCIFLEIAGNDKFSDIYKFALNTGMRESEILGLTKDCLDLANGFIIVKQQRQKIKGDYIISTPKTRQSIRQVPINQTTFDIIQKNLASNNEFLFEYKNKPVSQSSLGKHIRKVYQECYEQTKDETFLKANFHSLRHSFATAWVLQGGNVKLLSKVLGHTDSAFTMRVYVQPSYSDCANEMQKLSF